MMKQMSLRQEQNGKPGPVSVHDSEFFLDADLVLLAMGFVGPGPNKLVESLGLAMAESLAVAEGVLRRDAGE